MLSVPQHIRFDRASAVTSKESSSPETFTKNDREHSMFTREREFEVCPFPISFSFLSLPLSLSLTAWKIKTVLLKFTLEVALNCDISLPGNLLQPDMPLLFHS